MTNTFDFHKCGENNIAGVAGVVLYEDQVLYVLENYIDYENAHSPWTFYEINLNYYKGSKRLYQYIKDYGFFD